MNLQVRGFRISGSGFLVEGVGLQVQGWGFNVFAQGKVHCKASIRVAVATVRGPGRDCSFTFGVCWSVCLFSFFFFVDFQVFLQDRRTKSSKQVGCKQAKEDDSRLRAFRIVMTTTATTTTITTLMFAYLERPPDP